MPLKDSIYNFTVEANNKTPFSFLDLKGKVILIVNTASKCGFAPQLEGLEALHKKYGPKGLIVLGFPCDQFAHQEPGSAEEINQFCKLNYGVTFPIMKKIDVNGPNAIPIYKFLKSQASGILGKELKWNYTKFLVYQDGKSIKRFAPFRNPKDLEKEIETALIS